MINFNDSWTFKNVHNVHSEAVLEHIEAAFVSNWGVSYKSKVNNN